MATPTGLQIIDAFGAKWFIPISVSLPSLHLSYPQLPSAMPLWMLILCDLVGYHSKVKRSPSRGSLHTQGAHGIYRRSAMCRKKCGRQCDHSYAGKRNKDCQ